MVEFLDQIRFQQGTKRPVQCARSQSHTSTCLLLNLPHNGVTMKIFTCQSQKDVKGRRGQWIQFSLWHNDKRYIDERLLTHFCFVVKRNWLNLVQPGGKSDVARTDIEPL